jgi:hypothetical protein
MNYYYKYIKYKTKYLKLIQFGGEGEKLDELKKQINNLKTYDKEKEIIIELKNFNEKEVKNIKSRYYKQIEELKIKNEKELNDLKKSNQKNINSAAYNENLKYSAIKKSDISEEEKISENEEKIKKINEDLNKDSQIKQLDSKYILIQETLLLINTYKKKLIELKSNPSNINDQVLIELQSTISDIDIKLSQIF